MHVARSGLQKGMSGLPRHFSSNDRERDRNQSWTHSIAAPVKKITNRFEFCKVSWYEKGKLFEETMLSLCVPMEKEL